ncbi:MAG: GntR family transcriptional regulator [Kiritimatiellae bacterium]|nr:GntR family transcriptional regulator [Kiritimatiellia bacterium]
MATAKSLEKNSAEPMYRQLADVLRSALADLPPGAPVEGDRALCARFGVSQPVVRSALKLLVDEGLIRRTRSKGTFVETPSRLRPRARGKGIAVVTLLESFRPHIGAVAGVRDVMVGQNYEVVLSEPPPYPVTAEAIYPSLLPLLERYEGVVWISSILQEYPRPDRRLRDIAARVVFVNAVMRDEKLTCCMADYAGGAFAVTTHLIEAGYRTIGFLGGPADRMSSAVRREGFEAAMRAHAKSLRPEYCRFDAADMAADSGRRHIAALLAAKRVPEALFAVNDEMAAGVLDGLRGAGRRVPHDVALAGFDDSPTAAHLLPALTTVRQPYPELGRLAASLLADQLAGQAPGGKHYVPCPLVVRASTLRTT